MFSVILTVLALVLVLKVGAMMIYWWRKVKM